MMRFTLSPLALALIFTAPLAGEAATGRLTAAQLKVDANVVAFCRDKGQYVQSAEYSDATSNKVTVTCTDDAAGLLPFAGLGGLGGGAAVAAAGFVLAAVAVGGNDGPSDTQ